MAKRRSPHKRKTKPAIFTEEMSNGDTTIIKLAHKQTAAND